MILRYISDLEQIEKINQSWDQIHCGKYYIQVKLSLLTFLEAELLYDSIFSYFHQN